MDRQYSSLVGQAGAQRYSSYDVGSELRNAGWKPGQVGMQSGEVRQAQLYSAPALGTMPATGSYVPPTKLVGSYVPPPQLVSSYVPPTQVVVPAAYATPVMSYRTSFPAPQKLVQERVHEVRKPYVVERIVEVPKPEIRHVYRHAEPVFRDEEQIIEVPEVVHEERIIHVPRKEIQERLIEVPKIEWVETIEYEERIEYREVLVDKIIEVPEIEYRVNQVEQLVPQQYIEEYFVDNYKTVPMTQVQEVERTEHAPVAQMPLVRAPQVMTVSAPQVMTVSTPQLYHQLKQADSPPVPMSAAVSPPVPLSSNLSMVFPFRAASQAPRAAPVVSVGSMRVNAPTQQSYASYDPLAAGPKLLTPPTPPAAFSNPAVPLPSSFAAPAALAHGPSLVSVF